MNTARKGHIVLLTKEACSLCEDAERLLLKHARAFSVTVDTVDITTDEALLDEYGERVPVLLGVGSKVLGEGALSSFAIQRALTRVRIGL